MIWFKKGNRVVKVISTPSGETGSIHTINRVGKGYVQCDRDECLRYCDKTGRELDPAPGFASAGISSRLVLLEED